MAEYEFDLGRWTAMFPLDRVREETPYSIGGETITSPYHLAVVEQIRAEVAANQDLGRTVPTDVFVFGKGEPQDRHVTKVGGLPYRPADRTWPTARDGTELTFLAQFCFVESFDLTGTLPGDVLVIFAKENPPNIRDLDAFRFEWYRLGLRELVKADAVPDAAWQFVTCYGVRHRTVDYPDAGSAFEGYRRNYRLPILAATKIGGLPQWIQKPPKLTGKFLCCLSSIQVEPNVPYPWINQREVVVLDRSNLGAWQDEDQMLMWSDAGTVYFFLEDSGNIQWTMQSY